MKRAPSIIGRITGLNFLSRATHRAIAFATPAVAAFFLAFFPQHYLAATSLTPADPDKLGLSGTLGQLGAINSVFGDQAAVEVAMRVAKGVYVRNIVIEKLDLNERLRKSNDLSVHRWLDDHVDVRSLRGGIIVISLKAPDPEFAKEIVAAYSEATREQLAEVSRRQTAYKRAVLDSLVKDASDRLAAAQAAYDEFRLGARYPEPRSSMVAIAERIPELEVAIKTKKIEIAAARTVFTDANINNQRLLVELAELESQLAAAKAVNASDYQSVGLLVDQSSQLFLLERDLGIAQALYDNYLKYLQGTAVEDMTSTANMRILEPPYIDTSRQMNLPAMAAGLFFILLWFAVEAYRFRPPAKRDRWEPDEI